ncbi:TOBE domain-containing protein, partial [Pseudomonas syringae group genomosp. 7]|uniref:TOBE domain-containing protein n=1 Tax=Pseudomonas syringae group genomosp. 7 TaxID=251699 RepID=UPI00377025B0
NDPRTILTSLPVTGLEAALADNSAHVLVKLDAGGTHLLARITRYSSDQLNLHRGQSLWALIKAVAVLA